MEVKDANAALLSNFEVYQLLTDLKQQRKESGKTKQSSGQQNLNTIMYETLKYISKTPCRYQSPEIVREFLVAMKDHKLTKQAHPAQQQLCTKGCCSLGILAWNCACSAFFARSVNQCLTLL
ncbi:DNA-directed RNA polymerase III subunit RPC9 isoform X2 [Taeniopygia guttata]|uniref:DNA-directed RNA polymerase III subunit RPC9 isoform X2 n=1 Tax=Taeniopygia guttata TaxID=59729 RepID=UPI0011AFBB6F|nr:DNA-directed RNA polymerase III subunit RPC9 isoform X2 [Taeniopygia guttata]